MSTMLTTSFPLVIPFRANAEDYNPITDIYLTTQMILQHCLTEDQARPFGDTKSGILRSVIKACHRKNGNDLKAALINFNEQMVLLVAYFFLGYS